ncbi:MAG TPA: translation initiation factor IF-2, partial [Lachnospiraceae bacterium]|nr:translation initiation factor IF-2 [Lachnospiraceae bacterium]HCR82925.1 translation initiation factor IF-2 [Lachnospiraceae bacterium]
MAKMRVHELAKELGMENKELIDILAKKNVEVKSHMSSLEDEVVEDLRKRSKSKNSVEEPKKKNIVQVFRPQNSKSGGRMQGNSRFQGGNREGQRSAPSAQRQSPQGRRQTGTASSSQRPQENREGQRPIVHQGTSQGNQRTQTAAQETRRENSRYQGQNQRSDGGSQNPRFNNNRGPRPAGGQDRNQDRSHGRNQDGSQNRSYGGKNQDGSQNRSYGGNQDG